MTLFQYLLQNIPTYLILCFLPSGFIAIGSVRFYISSCAADDESILKFLGSLKMPLKWFVNTPSEILTILSEGKNVGKGWYLLERAIFSIPPLLAILSYSKGAFTQTGDSTQQASDLLLFIICSLTALGAWALGRSIVRLDRETKQERFR